MEEFMKRFNFKKERVLLVGVERESFLIDQQGKIVPQAAEMLKHLSDRSRFGYELSACQLEDRVGPLELPKLKAGLLSNEREVAVAGSRLGLRCWHVEIVPEDMPLDVYLDPAGRYRRITRGMPQHILSAACRVAGTHIHIGMPDHKTAMAVYGKVIKETKNLCAIGDGSAGQRLELYQVMAPNYLPFHFASWSEFYKIAVEEEFKDDPRKCRTLIRLSVHGTIEFRMFGATPDLDRIVGWAKICRDLCEKAMR
jgi:gamma-glutamyl:cysteine ligase YbdK (ATP-grasp superfamily)